MCYIFIEIFGIFMILRFVFFNGYWIVNFIGDNFNKKYFVVRVYDF